MMIQAVTAYPRVGDLAPDFRLEDLDGSPVTLSEFRGKKVILFTWASWCACREQLPVWQRFWRQIDRSKVVLLTVAMDAQGPEVVRPLVEAAGATYRALIDRTGQLAFLYDFGNLPNGWVIDEAGVIRLRMVFSMNIGNPATVADVEEALSFPPAEPPAGGAASAVHPAVEHFRQGVDLLNAGKKRSALEAWFAAADAAPDKKIIRKQIWHLLHPELFQPKVNWVWQAGQKEREIRQGLREANPIPNDWT